MKIGMCLLAYTDAYGIEHTFSEEQMALICGALIVIGVITAVVVIVLAGVHARPRCPACMKRRNPAASICPNCHSALTPTRDGS